MADLSAVRLKILVGGAAHRWHLGVKTNVTETVRAWRDHWPDAVPLPHPSWRNTGWLKANPWFADDVLPEVRARIREVLE
jgi:uracil-DNA glycosylase